MYVIVRLSVNMTISDSVSRRRDVGASWTDQNAQLQISGKVAGGVHKDSRNFSGHPYIGRIARSSLR